MQPCKQKNQPHTGHQAESSNKTFVFPFSSFESFVLKTRENEKYRDSINKTKRMCVNYLYEQCRFRSRCFTKILWNLLLMYWFHLLLILHWSTRSPKNMKLIWSLKHLTTLSEKKLQFYFWCIRWILGKQKGLVSFPVMTGLSELCPALGKDEVTSEWLLMPTDLACCLPQGPPREASQFM